MYKFHKSDYFMNDVTFEYLDVFNFSVTPIENSLLGFDALSAGVPASGDVLANDDVIVRMAGSSVFELSSLLASNGGDGSLGFVINGIDTGDFSGRSVSSAGDINGDGFDDFIIGADGGDPNGNSRAGESYVVFGSGAGFSASFDLSSLDGSNGFVINGIDASDASGGSVSGAGDINGDGFDDLIIGASSADPNGNNNGGESYVVFGTGAGFSASFDLSSLDGSNGFVINGIDASDFSGGSVSGAGDINGDGFDDLIIGAGGADPNGNSHAGESYVVFGSGAGFSASFDLSSLNGSNGFVINGIDEFDNSGVSVSGAGDVNGDGFDDLIIGAFDADPNGNSGAGESYVVFGTGAGFSADFDLSSLNGSNGFVINGVDGFDFSGASVSGAGDINGDGFDDLIIGAPSDGAPGSPGATTISGESYVVFGSASGFSASLDLSSLDGSNGFVINGVSVGDESGISVSSAGDMNGDGFDDIIIGARRGDPNGNDFAGESYVVFGTGAGFSASLDLSNLDGITGFVINGIDEIDISGNSVSSAGDINGDGFDDLIIGALGAAPNGNIDGGESYIIFGSADFGPTPPVSSDFETAALSYIENGGAQNITAALTLSDVDDTDLESAVISISAGFDAANDSLVFADQNGITGVYNAGTGVLTLSGTSSLANYQTALRSITYQNTFTTESTTQRTISIIVNDGDDDSAAVTRDIDFVIDETITGTSGDDIINGGFGDDIINGLAGNDTLNGGDGDDAINAGLGDDMIIGSAGIDTIDGGAGFDTVSYAAETVQVRVTFFTGSASVTIDGVSTDTLMNVESVIGGSGDDQLTAFDTSGAPLTLDGGAGNDFLGFSSTSDGFDSGTFIGGDGDDFLRGGDGIDTYDGGAGVDQLSLFNIKFGTARQSAFVDMRINLITNDSFGNTETFTNIESVSGGSYLVDTFHGDDNDNSIHGSVGGADNIFGHGGNDFLSIAEAGGTIDGGTGLDTLNLLGRRYINLDADANGRYDREDALVGGHMDLSLGQILDDGFGGTGVFINIENLSGTQLGDTLIGDAGDNTLTGEGGDDTLTGGAGNDTARYFGSTLISDYTVIDNGDGTYTVTDNTGVDGTDTLTGIEFIRVDDVDYDITAIAVAASPFTEGDDVYTGDGTDETLDGLGGNDEIHGAGGNDTIFGGAGNDQLFGDAGDDIIYSGEGLDTVNGGAGNDTIVWTFAGGINDYENGETYDGGTGTDTLVMAGAAFTGLAIFNLATGVGSDDNGSIVITNFENFDGSGLAAFQAVSVIGTSGFNVITLGNNAGQIDGGDGDDTLNGGAGDDTINGDAGDDFIEGGGGADVINGGAGRDFTVYAASAQSVNVDLQAGTASGGDADGDTFVDIEDVLGSAFDDVLLGDGNTNSLWGGAGDDTINGRGGDDELSGFAGSDTIIGGAGDDSLDGHDGDDILEGGLGADIFFGGAGSDTVTYINSGAGVTINLGTNFADGGEATGDTIHNVENITGSAFDDVLTGDSGANVLSGGAGANTLNGGLGDDTFIYDGGTNTIDGGDGFDTVSYASVTENITIIANSTSPGSVFINNVLNNSEIDSIASIEGFVGGSGDDYIFISQFFTSAGDLYFEGGAGNDFLEISQHNAILISDDTFFGGAGDDFMRGGRGVDYYDGGDGVDQVSNFYLVFGVARESLFVDLRINEITNDSFGNTETIINVEAVSGGSYLVDTFHGDDFNNTLYGSFGGADNLYGYGGDDFLWAQEAGGIIDGGTGIDTLQLVGRRHLNLDANGDGFFDSDNAVIGTSINISLGQILNDGYGGTGTFTNIENLTGTDLSDTLVGGTGSNVLDGGLGSDDLFGDAGDDILNGGDGDDDLTGGEGC